MYYVLIGGGLASATAAEHVRKHDADGEITIVGAEPHLPYNRPPLSKEYLRGDAEVRIRWSTRSSGIGTRQSAYSRGLRRPRSTPARSGSRFPAAKR